QEEEVGLNLQVDLRVCDNPKELTVQGKVILPKGSLLTVGLWRKDGAENWEKMDEETVEVEMGGRFVSSLSPFKESMRDNVTDLESMQEILKNSYEVKVTSHFRNDKEQPQSVIKTVGEGGKKIAGEWVTDQGADGKAIIYSQKYQLNPSVHGPACFSFKPEKI
ncbi:MAG: hypothetical protein JNN15_10330, partial [Blastocatellia bacterium]|nr:hypothetical protein [Blastocatellia bacterium]